MVKSKPPARSTTWRGSRLRLSGAAAIAAFVAWFAAAPAPATAKPSLLKVLVAAPVSDTAHATMSEALWTKFVDAYVGATVVPFDGPGDPTIADCRKAGADYLIVAPFDLRPRLPGMPNAAGRVAARTRLTVTNCITGGAVAAVTVNFDSDPPSNANEGDYESVPEITWAHAVPAALAKYPPVFARVARVASLSPPFALIGIKEGAHVAVGTILRDFATADHTSHQHPIVMTVTQVLEKYVQVTYSTLTGDLPGLGDLVEPAPDGTVPAPEASR